METKKTLSEKIVDRLAGLYFGRARCNNCSYAVDNAARFTGPNTDKATHITLPKELFAEIVSTLETRKKLLIEAEKIMHNDISTANEHQTKLTKTYHDTEPHWNWLKNLKKEKLK